MKRSRAALGVILFAACTAAPDDLPRAALEGRDWRLVSLRGQDAAELARLPHAVTLRFEGGRVQGFGGCNTLAGSYGVEGDRVTLGTLAGTLMACAPAVMAVETAFKEALAGTLRFEVAGDRLTLASGSDVEPGLAFDAAPPPRLEGVAWEVTGFNNGRQAVVSPRVGTRISLSFQAGSLVGHAGCNGFRASYTVEGERLAVGRAAATRKLCPGEGVMQQERELLAALESATTWTIDLRGMLAVHRADGERVLIAREAREPEAPR